MQYSVIVSDPPWAFSDGLQRMRKPVKRGAAAHYSTLSAADVAQLDVRSLASPAGCVLALWVPSTLLATGLDVMRAWGFTYKQNVVWVKTKKPRRRTQPIVDLNDELAFGMGRTFRQCHELALIGTSGPAAYSMLRDHSQRSVIHHPSMRHSQKPDELQHRLDRMYGDVPKLEMFARRQLPGWTCIGDAIDGQDVRAAIQSLVVR